MSEDVFRRTAQIPAVPLTADRATINWDGIIAAALNFNVQYAQGVNRYRTIGNQEAVILTTQPQGSINIQRIITETAADIFSKTGWNSCDPATITFTLGSCQDDGTGTQSFTATGCVVSTYQLQGEAEGLTIIDNITIEFLQLQRTSNLTSTADQ